MNFNSLQFAVFLPVVLALYWLSPARFRVPLLLIASYVFYGAWRPVYLVLIVGLTAVNYWFGKRIWQSQAHKKAWMAAAVTCNVLALCYFKYFYLLEDTFAFLTQPWLGPHHKLSINIILPLGISFFVFEFIHYVVDVYKGSEPVRDFISFALFPSFFPTQIAGPIKRFQDFVPQLKEEKKLSLSDFDDAMFLIISGLFKKVILADNLALFVNAGFSHPELFTGFDFWLFGTAFGFQVYLDFSGYADIARGAARLFGFKVPVNFNFPFVASSTTEFWQRWHITLGSWLRDYLYIPLGGSKNGRFNAARNLIITMMLGGLWHGAEFHLLLWGFYQGACLSVHREFSFFREAHPRLLAFLDTPSGHKLSVVFTLLVTMIGMSIFRSQNTLDALNVVRKMICLDGTTVNGHCFSSILAINYPLIFPTSLIVLPVLLIGQFIAQRICQMPLKATPRLIRCAYATILIFALMGFAPDSSPRFFYFQF